MLLPQAEKQVFILNDSIKSLWYTAITIRFLSNFQKRALKAIFIHTSEKCMMICV